MSKSKHKIRSLLLFNTIAISSMYLANRYFSARAVKKSLLGVGEYYRWKFGDIYYRKLGSGKPILLIHDLNNFSSGYEWNQLELKLCKNHTVYTIDLLGCGRSDKPAITYTSYLYVQLLSDFIQTVIGEKTDVAATGRSAAIVTMIPLFHPEMINHIIMLNPISLAKLEQIPERRSELIRFLINIPVIGTSIYMIKSCRQNVEYILTEKCIFNPFLLQQKSVDAYHEAAHRGYGKGKYLMASIDGFYLTVNIRNALKKIEQPITILYGNKAENGREIAESYAFYQPSISVKPIPDTKLLSQLENPDAVYKQIEEICIF